jgi:hypothetical protein
MTLGDWIGDVLFSLVCARVAWIIVKDEMQW